MKPARTSPSWRQRLARLAPAERLRLGAWLVVIVPLAVLGLGVQSRLHSTSVVVSGTDASHAAALTDAAFGESEQLMVLVQGPPRQLRGEVARLSRRIDAEPRWGALDPWSAGSKALLPKPGQAILLVSIREPFEAVADHAAPRLRALLERVVAAPFTAQMTGYADIAGAGHTETVSATERAELIAVLPLIIVLLLVFGSPVAASLPLLLGGTAAVGGWGLLDLINRLTPLDASALSLTTMIALALGIDYSLLMVARFRSELARGASVEDASRLAATRAGQTIRFAAVALAVSMICLLLLIPATVLKSAVLGVLVGLVASFLGATLALPPLLRLIGHDIDRFRLFRVGGSSGRWRSLGEWVLRRPLIAMLAVLALLAPLCVAALQFPTGPPDPRELPPDSRARQDWQAIQEAVGGTYASPFVITVAVNKGTLADARLHRLASFERRLARDPQTLAVLGPATVAARATALARLPRRLQSAGLKAESRRLQQLMATGYVTLAALDAAPPAQRKAAGFTINFDRGGDAVRFLVVQREPAGDADTHLPTRAGNPYLEDLKETTAGLGRRLGADAAVGGPSAYLSEFDESVASRLPLLIAALVAVTYLALAIMMRNPLLPLIAVSLNVITVGAAFGVLALVFGESRLLGGPGYVNDISAAVVLTVAFALSIDYEIFLLDRMREAYAESGEYRVAILRGLESTAGVIAGAGAIVVAVFLAFAISPVALLRTLGVGLAVAVAIDATLIRLVLLPAALGLAGDRAWRSPRWMAPSLRPPKAVPLEADGERQG